MKGNRALSDQIDGIVMLTWSNWFTELRSNRYHYATRFAKLLPVLFVQPDLNSEIYQFEKTEIPNVTIVHVSNKFDDSQIEQLNTALLEAGVLKPLFWTYNINFERFLGQRYSVITIYHGTEDYLASDSHIKFRDPNLIDKFNRVLDASDLLIAVSDGVADSFIQHSTFSGKLVTVPNGCDYKFYAPRSLESNLIDAEENIVFYQGNIFDKLDYSMLIELAKRMPTWQFRFCGKIVFNEKLWKKLCNLPNVSYLGLLNSEGIRTEAYKSTVGIIPFVENAWLIERSFPLKTFEYLACGLPVVSVPIKALLPYKDTIHFASGVEEFEAALHQAKALRFDSQHTKRRLNLAAAQDYDLKFEQVTTIINQLTSELRNKEKKGLYNVAIMYDPQQVTQQGVRDSLLNFTSNFIQNISYIPIQENKPIDLNGFLFDILIIYTIKAEQKLFSIHKPNQYQMNIKQFGGYKVLFTDSFNAGDHVLNYVKQLGVHCVYMNLAASHDSALRSKEVMPSVKFYPIPQYDDNKFDADRFYNELAVDVIVRRKKEKFNNFVYSLVATKHGNYFKLQYNPQDLFAAPSRNIFSLEELTKYKIINKTEKNWQVPLKEIINNIQLILLIVLRKFLLILLNVFKRCYQKMPYRIKAFINRMVAHYKKNKLIIKLINILSMTQ